MGDYEQLTRAELISLVRELKAGRTKAPRSAREQPAEFPIFGERQKQELEKSPCPMRIFDHETLKYLAVNDAALKLYGYSREEFLALTVKDTRHPQEHAALLGSLAAPMNYLSHWGAARHFKKSGEIIEVEAIAQDVLFDGRMARVSLIIDVTARVRMQELLWQRQQEFMALVAHAPDVVARIDRNFRHLYVNPAITAATGRPPGEFIGKTIAEVGMPPDLVARWDAKLNEVFATGREQNLECVFRGNNGARYYESRIVPERDANDGVETVLVITRDFTERKNAEELLRQREREFSSLAENLPDLIARFDGASRYIYVNAAVEKLTGKSRDEILGRTQRELGLPEELVAAFDESLADIFATGDVHALEFRYPVSGDERLFEALHVPEKDAHGKVRTVLCVAREITARKRAEAALRDSEERFRQLAENIRDVFWINTLSGDEVIYVSPAYEEIWGKSRDTLYRDPKDWLGSIHPEDLPAVRHGMMKMARGERLDIEYRIIRPDGTSRWIRDRSYHMKRGDGTPLACGIAQDITERKRAEEEKLARMARQRDALVREVHHRIKNNLQGVIGLLRRIIRRDPGTGPFIESAIAQLRSVALVHGLHGRSGHELTGLREMLDAVCASVEELTGAALVRRFEEDRASLLMVSESEAVPLALVLNELVFNAQKHAQGRPESRRIEISLRASERGAEIRVANPGHLPPGFDTGHMGGLDLVRTLLAPSSTNLTIRERDGVVEALLTLGAPVIVLPPAAPVLSRVPEVRESMTRRILS